MRNKYRRPGKRVAALRGPKGKEEGADTGDGIDSAGN